MIIQGMTLKNATVWDGSFINNGALLYVDAGQTSSYSGIRDRNAKEKVSFAIKYLDKI